MHCKLNTSISVALSIQLTQLVKSFWLLQYKVHVNKRRNKVYINQTQTTIKQMSDFIQKQPAKQENKQKKIGYYLIGKTIGEGTFGKVKLATHTLTGEKVAIKILVKQKIIDVADVQRVSRQIHILKLIRHPSIIQLYEIIETSRHLFLVMEYIQKGELFDYIVEKTKVEEDEACRYFKHMISGVAYLHQLNIVHRDLKPQNLLIDWKNSLKIVDFGLSNTYKPGQMLKTACGSPCYAAPEMIASKKYNGLQVDIWSCGVILFAMVCGYLPFQDSNTSQLYKKILSGQYVLPNFVSQQFKDLLEKILNVSPSKRYRLEQIYSHEWSKKNEGIPLNSGIIVGYHRIPIDKHILQKLRQFSFDIEYAERCIQANKHNHITTAYYLLLKKHLKNGYRSNADLSSIDFDYSSVQPFRRIQNEKKYNFFGKFEESAIINIQNKDIKLIKKKQKSTFSIKTSTAQNENKNSTHLLQNRRSNNFFEKEKGIGLGNMTTTSKKFNDLKMYLKQPKRKQYYSQIKKKIQRKNEAHSVFYEPKQTSMMEEDPFIIRMQTQHSQNKNGNRSSSKSGYKHYRKQKQIKNQTKSTTQKMNLNMMKSINRHLVTKC